MTRLPWDVAVAAGAAICTLMQFASFQVSRNIGHHALLIGGRALLLVGWVVATARLVDLALAGEPLSPMTRLWVGCFELGTLLITAHWIVNREDRC